MSLATPPFLCGLCHRDTKFIEPEPSQLGCLGWQRRSLGPGSFSHSSSKLRKRGGGSQPHPAGPNGAQANTAASPSDPANQRRSVNCLTGATWKNACGIRKAQQSFVI
jgi:hypothetical protein